MLAGTSITLIVSGSIAAYKSAELTRELVKAGASVRVVMTKAACEFITPLTMQTLSGTAVTTDLFDANREAEISHISLADSADVVLVAPATADIIAKAACGLADDAATTVLLATRAPIVIAPAMNVNMWENPITQGNIAKLQGLGVRFVEPEAGDLACGWVGRGRLAPNESILETVQQALHPQDMAGMRVIVTAGPTQEPLDPVRFLSNRSSGRMGCALARVARYRGAEVTLITGPSNVPVPSGVEIVAVTTAKEMRDAVLSAVAKPIATPGTKSAGALPAPRQFVCMSAAVADHSPKDVSAQKLKRSKSESYAIELEPAPDILKELGERKTELEKTSGTRITLVGFALETPADDAALHAAAKAKLDGKGADLLVGNTASALGNDANRVLLVDRAGKQELVETADKLHVAERIMQAAVELR